MLPAGTAFCPMCGRALRVFSPTSTPTPPPAPEALVRDPFETPAEFAVRLECLEARPAGEGKLIKAGYDIHTGTFPLEVRWAGWLRQLAPRPEGMFLVVPREIARPLFENGPSYPLYVYLTGSGDRVVIDWVELKAGPARYFVQAAMPHSIVAHDVIETDVPAVTALAFSPDGARLAFGGVGGAGGGEVSLWAVHARTLTTSLGRHGQGAAVLAFSPDGQRLAVGCWGAPARLWSLRDGTARGDARVLEGQDPAPCVAFHPQGELLACGGWDGAVAIWNYRHDAPERRLDFGEPVVSLAFSPDGRLLAIGGQGRRLTLFDTSSWQQLPALSGPAAGSLRVAFSRDGRRLAAGCADRSIALWQLPGLRPAGTLEGHSRFVWALAFSADASLLATEGAGESITLWDINTRRALATIATEHGRVLALAFSPDGSLLASAGHDGRVCLWRLLGYQTAAGRDALTSAAHEP
jgi:WD40 repeat protein